MNRTVIKQTVALELRECPTCGVTYGVTETFIEERLKSHETFYCPNGHSRYFVSKSREELLQEKNNSLNQEIREVKRHRNDLLEELGKVKKRANAGVCPHCHRCFANVKRHIDNKHKKG